MIIKEVPPHLAGQASDLFNKILNRWKIAKKQTYQTGLIRPLPFTTLKRESRI